MIADERGAPCVGTAGCVEMPAASGRGGLERSVVPGDDFNGSGGHLGLIPRD